ncbi:glucosaminidase domain-containing protein [Glaciecola siphonariae]|uniref:Glucosaminidase domain-containing protein n=1 Tax=Glaciecola siphonariae TaxID=521012 RepID=A0ABV9LSE2_9ALTE
MHKSKALLGAVLVILIGLLIWFRPQPSLVETIPAVEHADDPVPDFKQYEDVRDKKQAFFEYLKPAVVAQNDYFREVRQFLKELQAKVDGGNGLSSDEQEQLNWLIDEYRVETDQDLDAAFTTLLRRVDIIPVELVLVQSANESAWGTSRFAVEGYNFFGMWCFVEDCGFVPKRRNEGAIHEVAKYDDLSAAMYSYMRNLNRHPAYKELRAIRAELRASNKPITAMKLAEGLVQYSERGEEYIEELQQMIRVNRELI